MKTIQIDQDVYNYVLSKAGQAGESPSLILRRELHLPQPTETIEVDDDTYQYLLSKTTNLGESASDILRRELNLNEEPHHDPNHEGTDTHEATDIIVFHIPAGTGAGPWNTSADAVAAIVGNTLRIVNDDSAPHRLHTSGIPFPHPSADILPGKAADFLLQTPFDSGANRPLHDHDGGLDAQFWINVRVPQ